LSFHSVRRIPPIPPLRSFFTRSLSSVVQKVIK
jgi:hypothetical protein